MKTIDIDEELYRYIARHTQHIGESASNILRRLLKMPTQPSFSLSSLPESQRTMSESSLEKRTSVLDELLLSLHYIQQKRVVSRFIFVLSALYAINPQGFQAATGSIHGRTRVYFSTDRQTLTQHGVHTKPKQIPNTPYWVITNTNSDRKRNMLEQIMSSMQFPQALCEKVCATI